MGGTQRMTEPNTKLTPKEAFWTELNKWDEYLDGAMDFALNSQAKDIHSAVKKRFGDSFKCKKKTMRRKEIALRFIAYNVFILLCYDYSLKHNLPLYVRA